jgi:hypothetical protein
VICAREMEMQEMKMVPTKDAEQRVGFFEGFG